MSYEELMKHAQDIGINAYSRGIKELMATQSSTLYAQEEPKLEQRCFVEVPNLFQPFTQIPDPKSFDSGINTLKQALAKLCTGQDTRDPISTNGGTYLANRVLDEMTGSGDLIESWTGKAAMEFKSNFIDPFPSVVRNQFILVSALKSALEAEQAMWDAARHNIDDIAEQTNKALDGMHKSCSSHEWAITFTTVAAITGVLAAIPTFGGSVAITISAVGAVAWVAAAAPPEDAPKLKVGGGEVNAVLDSLNRAVTDATRLINETEARIAKSVSGILDTIHGNQDYFVAKRPGLVGSTKNNITDPDHMGYSN
jgi:uncharacterized protein YukE